MLFRSLGLAACAPAQEGPSGSAGPAPASTAPGTPDASGGKKTYDEHLTLTWLMAGIKSGGDYSGDDWGRYWLDTYNIDFDIIATTIDVSDWDERLRVWINSGDMPDVAHAEYPYGEIETYAAQDAIYRFPDDWKERWPNLAKTQDDVPISAIAEEKLGGTYCLWRPVFSTNRPDRKSVV